jgi:hypothetical protein
MHGWLGHARTKGLQAMQPYDYYWRLDTDSFLIGAVPCVHGARCRHPPARGSPAGLRDLGQRYARAWVRVGAGAICSACSQGTCTLGVLMGTREHSRVGAGTTCLHTCSAQARCTGALCGSCGHALRPPSVNGKQAGAHPRGDAMATQLRGHNRGGAERRRGTVGHHRRL